MATEPTLKRHNKYYFDDGNVIFQVERTLFNIHRSFLCRDREGVFSSMFKLPSGDEPEGTSDKNPIVIPDVPLLLFTDLIRILYSSQFFKLDHGALPIKRWAEVLELADKFGLESAIPLITSSIEKLTVEEKNLVQFLATACDFRSAFTTGFIQKLFQGLCERDLPLTAAEGKELGGALAALIGRCREHLIRGQPNGGSLRGREANIALYYGELAAV